MKTRRNHGFSLVEILIVVVILGILAAIVIPQFSQASAEARESSLASNLQTLRSQISLYQAQHNEQLPNAGAATFAQCMTGQTDLAGAVWVSQAVSGRAYGRYMRKVPVNPLNDKKDADGNGTIRIDGAAAGANTHSWRFDTTSGLLQADDNLSTLDNQAHTAL